MQIAPLTPLAAAAPTPTPRAFEPIPGWMPTIKAAIPASTRGKGLIRGGVDAWRGVPEQAGGVRLSDAMLGALTPFFATQFKLDPKVVREDLSKVRVLVSGLAHDAGGTATTIGHAIYVSDAERAVKMLKWEGRRWLAHELAHTMQWRQSAAPTASESQRDRSFLNRYLSKFVADDGSLGKGGIVLALREWLKRQKASGEEGVGDALHDAHPMERQAETVARTFLAQTS